MGNWAEGWYLFSLWNSFLVLYKTIEPTPGRFYGLVKNQKGVPEGEKIPPLRPVVSGSGSNTEMISWLVDQEAKHMVPKLDSYWQDTPHALRDLEEENSQCHPGHCRR